MPSTTFILFLLSFKVSSFSRPEIPFITEILLLVSERYVRSVWLLRLSIYSILLFAKESSRSCNFENIVGTVFKPKPYIERTFNSVSIDKSGRSTTLVLPIYNLWSFLRVWTILRSLMGFYLTYKESRLGLFLISSKFYISF